MVAAVEVDNVVAPNVLLVAVVLWLGVGLAKPVGDAPCIGEVSAC